MEKITELVNILKRIDVGERPELIRESKKSFLETVTARDLAEAEHYLMKTGVLPRAMRHLSCSHIDAVGKDQNFYDSMPADHPLKAIRQDHQYIEDILQRMLKISAKFEQMDYITPLDPEYEQLNAIVDLISNLEKIEDKEEEIILPELAKRGFYHLLDMLESEHEETKLYMRELKVLANNCCSIDFKKFCTKLSDTIGSFVEVMREHLCKMDNIVYPAAFEVIDDVDIWQRIRALAKFVSG